MGGRGSLHRKTGVIRMKIKYSTINAFIFFLAIVTMILTTDMEQAGMISMLKYLVCCIGIAFSVVCVKLKSHMFQYELKSVLWVIFSFAIITAIKTIVYGGFTNRSLYEMFFLALPILYAYCLINTVPFNVMDRFMFFTLIFSFVGYVLSLRMGFTEIIAALSSLDFAGSSSLLESHSFSGISIALALYYLYFRKNKVGMILSILFVVMTFKRLAVLTVIILVFLPKLLDKDKPVNKNVLNIAKIIIAILGFAYFAAMIPSNIGFVEKLFRVNLKEFTMGRTYRFLYAYRGIGFRNGGLGSVYTNLMNTYHLAIEMDIAKLMFEVTPLGVLIFINNLFNVSKKSVYCFLVMIYLFVNMITSHCLASVFTWLIIYITFGMIEYKQYELKV